MKLTELWGEGAKPTLSFELFPARSEKAAARLDKVIDKLTALEPDFLSVTFGAGGSTREGSRQLVEKLRKDKEQEVLAYFACYGLPPAEIEAVIGDDRALGVDTILAVRGDPPQDQPDFEPHPDAPAHASDLLALLREKHPDLCLGAAGYPEGHIEAEGPEADLKYAKLKVEQGAEFLVTNYTYANEHYFDYVAKVRARGVEVPILPGVMPIFNVKMMENLAKLCGAEITEEIRQGLAEIPDGDKGAVSDFGVELAVRQCRGLLEGGAPGVHLYTMDRSKSVLTIVERLRSDGLL